MSEHTPTFEEVDKAVQSADLTPFQQGGRHHFTAAAVAVSPGDVLKKICAAYKIVRPIMALIAGLPLIPSKWKEVVKTFMGLMDSLCP